MANTKPSLFERIRDIIHSYDAAESLARELAEGCLDNLLGGALGMGRVTVQAALPEAVNTPTTQAIEPKGEATNV